MTFLKIAFWLLTTTFTGSIGAIYLKKAMDKMPVLSVHNILRSKDFYLGSFYYIVSAGTNIVLFKYLDYSIAFPLTSISYIWTIIISYFMFREKINVQKLLAIIFIIVGVFFLGRAG
ncbi:EamA family transporter [Streptococcaceae bacterium ESL0729]|nr:EamA family transporter [Streptococcaceae bacterium ESL0729]